MASDEADARRLGVVLLAHRKADAGEAKDHKHPSCRFGDGTAGRVHPTRCGRDRSRSGDRLVSREEVIQRNRRRRIVEIQSESSRDRLPETGARCSLFSRFAKPGKISKFYSYARQVGSLHDHEDTFASLGMQTLQTSPTVVDVSRDLITLWNEKATWDEASKFIDCVIDVQESETPADPGRFVKE